MPCAWSPDGGRLVSGGADGSLRLWDAAGGEPLAVLERHTDSVRACAWSPDGGRLVSGGADGSLRLWDAAGGEPLAVLEGHGFGPCLRLVAGRGPPDLGWQRRSLRLWDAVSGEQLAVLEGHTDSVHAYAWSPDGGRLVSAGRDGSLRLWDAATGKPLTVIQMLPDREHTVLEPDGSGFRSASPGA